MTPTPNRRLVIVRRMSELFWRMYKLDQKKSKLYKEYVALRKELEE